jgi:muramidase (phage lysozyme)
VQRESGGDYKAENPTSTASGKYQFVDGTWNGYGGYSHASDAPPEVQDAKACEVWADGAGASNWVTR